MASHVPVDFERLAEEIRMEAGVGPEELVSSLTIARRLLGVPVRIVPTLPTYACLRFVDGQYRILIRKLEREAHFAVAHELGHWGLRERAGLKIHPREEDLSNKIAGAICAPPAVVNAVVKGHPARHFRPLSKATGLSETAAALRLRDLRGDDLAVVTARRRNVLGGFRGLERETAIALADGREKSDEIVVVQLRGGLDTGRVELYRKRS